MENLILEKPLRGIIPPMVTPLRNNCALDVEALERLIEHILRGGVHGLFILGTTGEGASLKYDLRRQLISLTCQKVNGRVPVLVGITDCSVTESLQLADAASSAGATALVAAPPFYFYPDQMELVRYFLYLADKVTLPLFLYNIPSLTKVAIESTSVRMLAQHERIVGLKDSSGDGTYFSTTQAMMKSHPSFSLFVGPDEMLASLVLSGAHGGVSAGANHFPGLYVDLYHAAIAKNFSAASVLHQKVMEISRLIYNPFPVNSGFLKGIKAALSVMGICDDQMEFPLNQLDTGQKEIIKKNLSDLKLMDQ